MYDLVRGGATNWGLEGYKVPNITILKTKAKDDLYLMHIGKKKRPKQAAVKKDAQRGGIFRSIEK